MKTPHLLFLPLLLAFSACDSEPKAPSTLPPDAAAEYLQMRATIHAAAEETLSRLDEDKPFFREEDPYRADIRRLTEDDLELLERYERSGDVKLRSRSAQQTMLHHAVQHRKEALVRELLRQGADPNALCDFSFMGRGKMDAPLAWVAVPHLEGDERTRRPYAETAIRLTDMLVAAGASVEGDCGGHALFMCSISDQVGAEELYLHLLELGARPDCGYFHHMHGKNSAPKVYLNWATDYLLRNIWTRSVEALIDKGFITPDQRTWNGKTLLQTILEQQQQESSFATAADEETERSSADFPQRSRQCVELVRMLLEHGANPNAPQGGGWTPMSYAAAVHPELPEAQATWAELRALLLRHGGDPDASIPARGAERPKQQRSELSVTFPRAPSSRDAGRSEAAADEPGAVSEAMVQGAQ